MKPDQCTLLGRPFSPWSAGSQRQLAPSAAFSAIHSVCAGFRRKARRPEPGSLLPCCLAATAASRRKYYAPFAGTCLHDGLHAARIVNHSAYHGAAAASKHPAQRSPLTRDQGVVGRDDHALRAITCRAPREKYWSDQYRPCLVGVP